MIDSKASCVRIHGRRASVLAAAGLLLGVGCGDAPPPAPQVDASALRGEPLALAPQQPTAQAPIVTASELLADPPATASTSATAATNANTAPAQTAADLPIGDGPGGGESLLPPRPQRDVAPPQDSEAAKVEAAGKTGSEAKVSKDYKAVNFKDISTWSYVQPTAKQLEQDPDAVTASAKERIPAAIWALDGQKIALEGFMSPIDFDKTGVKSFSLIHNAIGCCFGMFPKMNEWVFVEMAGDKKCDFFSVEPATIYGTFAVGEEIKDGYVVSLFRMKADHVYGTF
jgi:hypothetical protein